MTDSVELLVNPPNEYWIQICKLIVEAESWLNSLHDYKTWKEAFGDDFELLVAVDKESKAILGCITVVHYYGPNSTISMIGCYFVTKENRGRGLGVYLFDQAKARCKGNTFLFGAASMTKKYADVHHFNKITDYAVVRRTVVTTKLRPLLLNNDPTLILKHPSAVGWDEIEKYLKKYVGKLNIIHVVKALLIQPGSYPLVALTTENRIVALGTVREQHGETLSVGPLIGNDPIAACSVLRGILLNIDNLMDFKAFAMESPTTNEESDKIIKQLSEGDYKIHFGHELQPQFTEEIVPLPVAHVYAIGQSDVSLL
ncbi:unnamed protein product [Bursaphelenchus xylophilus]|uniref:(pine wood nematode) hypothetical protein n=1 Tax=Bursaphelenchus xylophilus TaxID=6326 RepID=A0A7I8X094_BURXY|nr:unnamed protein product [Bursaphelenchus xylophilus]CAG9129749.1 unnamed protein product [Bursaphelenchus xylophilus]